MVKRGYENGARIIEIIEGTLDVVLYNNKETSFYFYRFNPEDVLKTKIGSRQTIIDQKEIRDLLDNNEKNDYQGFINELILKAIDAGMNDRYEM
jgi:hypothetical protein